MMQIRIALLFAAALALLLTGCSAGRSTRLAPMLQDGWVSGSASGDDEGHEHAAHDHDHEHDHGDAQAKHPHDEPRSEDTARLDVDTHAHTHLAGDHHEHDHAPRRLVRTNLRCGWCWPAEHYHASACGTPYVHGFLTEPAFLGRDFFFDVTIADDETEVEAELEWSLTKRLGLVAELPYTDGDESGIGDAALGLRALLVEERRFVLSASTEIELPTGSESKGLGSGAVALGASIHTWTDLGSWVTLQTVTGLEHVPDEDETEFTWSVALAKSFPACPLIRTPSCDGHDHGPSTFNLIAEIQGVTALSGDTGETEGRWLLGGSYPLTSSLDLRAAFSRSFGGTEDEEAWTLGLIFHF